jgi:hypothetical protein
MTSSRLSVFGGSLFGLLLMAAGSGMVNLVGGVSSISSPFSRWARRPRNRSSWGNRNVEEWHEDRGDLFTWWLRRSRLWRRGLRRFPWLRRF